MAFKLSERNDIEFVMVVCESGTQSDYVESGTQSDYVIGCDLE
jgi:hypothetical protein